MDNFPPQSRKPAGRGESADNLGRVPDGYSIVTESGAANWTSETSRPPENDVYAAVPATKKSSAGKTAGRAIREIVETLVLAALIFFGVRLLVLNFKVDGQSMLPNLVNNELLLVNRNAYGEIDLNKWLNKVPGVDRNGTWVIHRFAPPERGDVIVFDPPNGDTKPYIKRVIATAGETVTFKDDKVWVDGAELPEPYIHRKTDCEGQYCNVTVPDDYVFVLGDNRTASSDSRAFGPVPIDSIIGKAIVTYWPADEIGLVPHHDYPDVP
jgi:signal peptidase I